VDHQGVGQTDGSHIITMVPVVGANVSLRTRIQAKHPARWLNQLCRSVAITMKRSNIFMHQYSMQHSDW